MLHEQRFWDAAPASVYAALLDEGRYLCSIATMYRLLRAAGETGDRRRHATHPARVKPELLATAPNQVYSWDITKLHGPAKWTYYYLYVILDVFSRYVVGWMVAAGEAASLAERLLADTITAQGVAAVPAQRACRPGHLDDLQAGRHALERPGRHQVPLPSPRAR